MAEATDIIRRHCNGEYLTYRSRYFHTRDAHLYLQPPIPIPLVIAAYGVRTAHLTGKSADGWMTTAGPEPISSDTRQIMAAVDDGARLARRDPSTLLRMVEVKVIVASDRAQALPAM